MGIPSLGFQEILFLAGVILILNITGLWPYLMRGLRDLRGDPPGPGPSASHNASPTPTPANLEICYRLLGLSPSATWEEIEKAYRNKAKVHHPDRGGDEDAMRTLNEAYNMLKRTKRR